MNKIPFNISDEEDLYSIGYYIMIYGMEKASKRYEIKLEELIKFCKLYKIPYDNIDELVEWVLARQVF
jgi:hypothetical protein